MCKNIVAGWNTSATLDEFYDAILYKANILLIERLKRKRYDKENKKVIESVSSLNLITWEGNVIPREVRIYEDITAIRS